MKATTLSEMEAKTEFSIPAEAVATELVAYYTRAGEDYRAWSSGMNMHFGYWRRGVNPFRLEEMLEAMNREVMEALALSPDRPARIADLGCGVGATLRHMARLRPDWRFDGVTLVPWQLQVAAEYAGQMPHDNIRYHRADYRATGLASESFDAVYLLESMCHDEGGGKKAVLEEAVRLLRPGGRLVLVDGFLKRPQQHPRWFRRVLREVCQGWAMSSFPEKDAVIHHLGDLGMGEMGWRDLFWRLAPSGLHVPRVTAAYLWQRARSGNPPWCEESRRHVRSCVLSPLVGLCRPWFAYGMLTTRKNAS
ncbi:MAG: methyltransferase domain-containing protein [Verrucomicrobia bacterium]|nr:methyltransferase domain-containing protein [Verrucomicrobiota bacterium]MCH8513558.1 methyltransferase domain-containing protein [Kiritimatiellia bacterium]